MSNQRYGRAFRITNPEALAGLEEVKAGLNRLGFPAGNAEALTYGVNIARAVLNGQLVRAEDAEAWQALAGDACKHRVLQPDAS